MLKRSGYLYMLQHPEEKNWVKIGFTRLSPLSRLKSLSGTSVRTPFIFIDACFLWDVLSAEKKIHEDLVKMGFVRQKEFFKIDPNDIIFIKNLFKEINENDDFLYKNTYGEQKFLTQKKDENLDEIQEEYTDDSYDDMCVEKELQEEYTDQLHSSYQYIKKYGLQSLEKKSSLGFEQASLSLAHYSVQTELNAYTLALAHVFFQAAYKQGNNEALLQYEQWKSLVYPEQLSHYWACLYPYREKIMESTASFYVQSIFQEEQDLWKIYPERAFSWSNWIQNNFKKNMSI